MAWEEHDRKIFEADHAAEWRQYHILHADPPRNSAVAFEAMAFALGLTRDELSRKITDDYEYFKIVFNVAGKEQLSWEEAEEIVKKKQIKEDKLLDKISRYHNSNQPKQMYPKEVKPPKIFKNRFKKRSGPTKKQLADRAKWYKAQTDINMDRATPLDEYPDIFKDENNLT